MRKKLIWALVCSCLLSMAFAFYVRTTFTRFPPVFQMEDKNYVMSEGFSHFFDLQEYNLAGLMEASDAVVIACRMDEGRWTGRSIQTHLEIRRNIKGNLQDGVTYYEPVTLLPDCLMGVYGYLPMQTGHEYLLFLKKVDDPMRMEEYYPVCGDIGKFERGKLAKLNEKGTYAYGQVKDDALFFVDETGGMCVPGQRVEIYNEIMKEIEDEGLWG